MSNYCMKTHDSALERFNALVLAKNNFEFSATFFSVFSLRFMVRIMEPRWIWDFCACLGFFTLVFEKLVVFKKA